MSAPQMSRGCAPIGFVDELPDLEARAVLLMRLWCDSSRTQAAVREDFLTGLGALDGARAARDFGALIDVLQATARRPVMRHKLSCKCLGADESAFANLVGAGAEGAREDAFLIAVHMVPPCAAPLAADLAQHVGLALKRMTLHRDGARRATHASPDTPH